MFRGSKFLIGAALILLVLGILSIGKDIIIKYFGKEIIGEIVKVPKECSRHSQITVAFQDRYYEVNIAGEECRRKVFKVGQPFTLLKTDSFDEAIRPTSQPGVVLIIIILVLIISCFLEAKKVFKK